MDFRSRGRTWRVARLYSEIALSRKPLGIGQIYLYNLFWLEWPILWPPRLMTFPPGTPVYIAIMLRTAPLSNRGLILGRARIRPRLYIYIYIYIHHGVQTGCIPIHRRVQWIQQPLSPITDHSLPSSVEVWHARSYISTPSPKGSSCGA
jgi:hypothetical protein